MVFPEIFPEQIGDPELTGKSRDIGPLVDNFQDKLSQFSKIPFNKIRYLGKIMGQDWDKLSQNTGNSIIINEKSIPITPENKDIIESEIDSMITKHKETKKLSSNLRKPDIGNLIPALKQLYDDGKLLKSVAENYSQLSEDRQRVQLASEMSRIALLDKVSNFQSKVEDLERDLSEAEDNAEKTMMDKVANVTRRIEERTKEDIEATKTELEEVRKELAKANVNIRNELDKSIREEVEAKYRKDFEAAKRKEKDAMESMSAAHKKNDELEAENKRLIEQNGVINPTQIDNKWASMFDSKSKDVLEYIEIMKNEVSRAGGYPENAIGSLNSMVKKINIQIDALEGNAIIEIERNLNV